jgi:hypothetical protein
MERVQWSRETMRGAQTPSGDILFDVPCHLQETHREGIVDSVTVDLVIEEFRIPGFGLRVLFVSSVPQNPELGTRNAKPGTFFIQDSAGQGRCGGDGAGMR